MSNLKENIKEWVKVLLTPRKEIQYFRMKRKLKHILFMLEEEQKKQL